MAKYEIFRLHRSIDDAGVASLSVIPKQSDNNPQYVYSGYVNSAKVSIVNQGERVLLFFVPLARNAEGRVYRHYSRAVLEVDGTPEEIAEKVNALSVDPFNESYYNKDSRQVSYEYYQARQEVVEERKAEKKAEKVAAKKASGKGGDKSKEYWQLKKKLAGLQRQLKAAQKQ
jgi:hypothetical protein